MGTQPDKPSINGTNGGTFQVVSDMEPKMNGTSKPKVDEHQESESPDIIIDNAVKVKAKRMRRKRNKWTLIVTFSAMVLIIIFITIAYLVARGLEKEAIRKCNPNDMCEPLIVETIPGIIKYKPGSPVHDEISEHWKRLISIAKSNINILSFYWTLQSSDVPGGPYEQAKIGEEILDLLKIAANRGVKIQIVQKPPDKTYQQIDTIELSKLKNVEVRSLDMARLLKSGIIHTKAIIVDDRHVYIGSANFDWRALTEVKELGTVVYNCTCTGYDAKKIFDINWAMARDDAEIPYEWPHKYETEYSKDKPMILQPNDVKTFISTSPPEFCTKKRTKDLDAILDIIGKAKKFIYIAVMDYYAAVIYSYPKKFWPDIDNALREAMYTNHVEVRLLSSNWSHTDIEQVAFLKSLNEFGKIRSGNGSLIVRMFTMPSSTIPFSRVNHNKYMVTDNAAFISTSNWSGDYFISTGGISIMYNQTTEVKDKHKKSKNSMTNFSNKTLLVQLKDVFERDWTSSYAKQFQ